MARAAAASIALALLAGCAADQPPAAAPQPVQTPVASGTSSAVPQPSADQCGASDAQIYVGRPRTEIPVPIIPDWQRVACTTCPMTMEYMPKRLNFLYDADTGIIKQVKCG